MRWAARTLAKTTSFPGRGRHSVIRLLRGRGAERIVVAAPVAAPDTAELLREKADEVFIILEPEYFRAVGLWYDDFSETSDVQVNALLDEWKSEHSLPPIG